MILIDQFSYPEIYHFPWSKRNNQGDLGIETFSRYGVIPSIQQFEGLQIVVTEKYSDKCLSLHQNLSSQLLENKWDKRFSKLPQEYKIIGRNLKKGNILFIEWFEVISIFDENNVCLSWEEIEFYCKLLNFRMIQVIWKGIWDLDFIKNLNNKQEGYILRASARIPFHMLHIFSVKCNF